MILLKKINNDLKEAMKKKDSFLLNVLRMTISAVKNKKIELKSQDDLNDEQILEVIKSEVKKRKDSLASYIDAGRDDLAKIEKDEIKILEKYLPEQMNDEDLKKIVQEIINSMDNPNMKDFGKIMSSAVQKLEGQVDGSRISNMVKKILD